MELYNFEKLDSFLTDLGFPHVKESRFKIFRKDFTEEAAKGTLKYKDGKFYLIENGIESLAYFYIKNPDILRYKLPKFHITECKTIVTYKSNNNFDGHYYLSNNNVVDLIDRQTKKEHKDQKLELCKFCQQIFPEEAMDTQDFFDRLIKDEMKEVDNQVVDIFGYTSNWHQISRTFRKIHNHTCHKCNVQMKTASDFRFIHVHHKNGNKRNINESNLECLCIRCHSRVDQMHLTNFQNPRLSAELENFNEKYPE
jgi:hypothetical protein